VKEATPKMSFSDGMRFSVSLPLARYWVGIGRDAVVVKPAKRRAAGAPLPAGLRTEDGPVKVSLHLAHAEAALVDWVGIGSLRFNPKQNLYVGTMNDGRKEETYVYEPRNARLFTSSAARPSFQAGILFACQSLLARMADFGEAHLEALKATKPQKPALNRDAIYQALLSAQDELLFAALADLDADSLSIFTEASGAELPNTTGADWIDLKPLVNDIATLGKHLAGEDTIYKAITPSIASPDKAVVDADGFIGPQLEKTKRYMLEGKHVFHHGPTGTGKTFVWRKAMGELGMLPENCESIDDYPYRIHGSGGLEDWQFIGAYALLPDGTRQWANGPLTQAMLDGKRLVVEELNRMPVAMQNILIGAMDYGVISLTQYDSRVIKMTAGFAIDAMANIGAEFVGTEDIDPAIMRRFQRKIAYDYLPEDDEVELLRSRTPKLNITNARVLVRIANTIRQQVEEGPTSVDVENAVSPAALLESAALVAQGYTIKEAIEDTWLAEVAKTKPQRESVREAIDSHLSDTGKASKKKRP